MFILACPCSKWRLRLIVFVTLVLLNVSMFLFMWLGWLESTLCFYGMFYWPTTMDLINCKLWKLEPCKTYKVGIQSVSPKWCGSLCEKLLVTIHVAVIDWWNVIWIQFVSQLYNLALLLRLLQLGCVGYWQLDVFLL